MERLRRLAGSLWVRFAVSVVLLTTVATRINFGAASERILDGRWYVFAAAVAVSFGSFALAALRWRLFLVAAGLEASGLRVIRAYLIGVFTLNFLPSQFGGDVARAYVIGRPGTRVAAGATVVIDRVTAIACLVLLALFTVAVWPGAVTGAIVYALAASAVALVAGVLAALLLSRQRGRLARRLPTRVGGWGRVAVETARVCLRRDVIVKTVVLGVVFQLTTVFGLWLVARSLELHLSFVLLAAVLPPVLLISALPISIGGLGVREWSFVVLLGQVGISATDATVLSLATAIAHAVAGLPGAAMLIVRLKPKATILTGTKEIEGGR